MDILSMSDGDEKDLPVDFIHLLLPYISCGTQNEREWPLNGVVDFTLPIKKDTSICLAPIS